MEKVRAVQRLSLHRPHAFLPADTSRVTHSVTTAMRCGPISKTTGGRPRSGARRCSPGILHPRRSCLRAGTRLATKDRDDANLATQHLLRLDVARHSRGFGSITTVTTPAEASMALLVHSTQRSTPPFVDRQFLRAAGPSMTPRQRSWKRWRPRDTQRLRMRVTTA